MRRQQGFIAQELYQYYPEAVTVGGENAFQSPWLVDYGRLTPLVVRAVQELNLKVEDLASTTATSTDSTLFTTRFFSSLFSRLTQWFADAANGIQDFYATIIHAKEGNFAEEFCVGSTCVNEQLAALIASAGQPAAAPASSPSSGGSSSDPPAPPTPESSTSPAPSDAATTSPATKTEPTPPVSEPIVEDSPPLAPEEHPEQTPATSSTAETAPIAQ